MRVNDRKICGELRGLERKAAAWLACAGVRVLPPKKRI